jgi:hypothetical protein
VKSSPDYYRADAAFSALAITTPGANNVLTHPSVQFFADGWHGYRYWMAATPYDGTDSTVENPCIFASQDGVTWVTPAGVTNPIEAYPGSPQYNSDTELVFGPDQRLYCVWRMTGGTNDVIYYRASSDGIDWSDRHTVLSTVATSTRPVSHTIVWDGTQWVMYQIDIHASPYLLTRRTAAALTGAWSAAVTCTVPAVAGRDLWHINARLVGGEVHILLQDCTAGSSGNGGNLYLMASADGTTFSRSTNPVVPQAGAWHQYLYRSCLVPAMANGQDGYEVFYAGYKGADATSWKVGRTFLVRVDPVADAATRAAASVAATRKVYPWTAGDTFSRADGVTLGTAESGQTWTTWTGVPGISGQQAYATTVTNTKAVIDAGTADGYFECSIAAVGSQAYLCFRGVDTSNYYRFGYQGGLLFQKVVAGAVTSLATALGAVPTVPVRLGARCSGTTITLYADGQALAQVTDAALNGTLVGFQITESTSRIDDITARALINGL